MISRSMLTDPSVNFIRPLVSKNSIGLLGLFDALVVVSSAALLLAVTGGCDNGMGVGWQPKATTALPTVQMVDAIEVTLTNDAYQATSFVGALKPRRNIPLAFTQGGRVAKIKVTNGQQVTADQVLAQTDTAGLDIQKADLEAALQTTRQRLEVNQNSMDLRTQISDQQQELKTIDQAIANATIKAPFKGVITKRAVEEGQVVSAGMPLFDLVDDEDLIVEVKVATPIANGMKRGELVWVLIKGQPLAASIATVLPTSPEATRTRTVTLEFRDGQPAQTFNPGDAVEISYWTRTGKSGFWLPYSVLQRQTTGLWSAMIVEDKANDTFAQPRTLDMIQLHDDLALVQGALNQGDRVIINGLNRIVPGQRIQANLIENELAIPSPEGIAPATEGSDDARVPSAPNGTLP